MDERATIKVTRAGETMPVFCGWFDGIKRPSFKSKKPQEYHCLGHSAILYHRFPHVRAYTSNDAISNIFGDTVASQGILFQASSLMPSNWQDATWMGAPAGTFSAPYYTGTDFPQRIPVPTPAVYLGATLLTQAASLAGMAVNQWFRDADYLYVRTGVAEPGGQPEELSLLRAEFQECPYSQRLAHAYLESLQPRRSSRAREADHHSQPGHVS